MKNTLRILTSFALVGLAACRADGWGHRSQSPNPDERLTELLAQYEEFKREAEADPAHILVDGQRVKHEIARLSMEFPRHVPTLLANAAISMEHDEFSKCQSFCDRLLTLEPANADAAVLRSQVALREGNMPYAKRLLEAQKSYAPDHAGVREALSATLFLMKDLEGAGRELNAAEQLGAPAWRVAYHRGLLAEAKGDSKGAMAAYQASIDANPDFVQAKTRLAGRKAEGGVQ
jgi:tetratricopeptide (TPR) repeat protein